MWLLVLSVILALACTISSLTFEDLSKDACFKETYSCEEHRVGRINEGEYKYIDSPSKFREMCRQNRKFISCVTQAKEYCSKTGNISDVATMTLENRWSLKLLCTQPDWKKDYFTYVSCINKHEEFALGDCYTDEHKKYRPSSKCLIWDACSSAKEIEDCMALKLERRCGPVAAEIYRRLYYLKLGKFDIVCEHRRRNPNYCPNDPSTIESNKTSRRKVSKRIVSIPKTSTLSDSKSMSNMFEDILKLTNNIRKINSLLEHLHGFSEFQNSNFEFPNFKSVIQPKNNPNVYQTNKFELSQGIRSSTGDAVGSENLEKISAAEYFNGFIPIFANNNLLKHDDSEVTEFGGSLPSTNQSKNKYSDVNFADRSLETAVENFENPRDEDSTFINSPKLKSINQELHRSDEQNINFNSESLIMDNVEDAVLVHRLGELLEIIENNEKLEQEMDYKHIVKHAHDENEQVYEQSSESYFLVNYPDSTEQMYISTDGDFIPTADSFVALKTSPEELPFNIDSRQGSEMNVKPDEYVEVTEDSSITENAETEFKVKQIESFLDDKLRCTDFSTFGDLERNDPIKQPQCIKNTSIKECSVENSGVDDDDENFLNIMKSEDFSKINEDLYTENERQKFEDSIQESEVLLQEPSEKENIDHSED